jgi:lincosamide nucleotidyltransferase A/C/D/E
MDEDEVLRVIDRLTAAGIRVWVEGGWGVDALVGKQTRRHDDLDLALPLVDVERALDVLIALGYHLVEDNELPTRADLRADDDRRVDLHPLSFDTDGNGLQQLSDGSFGTYTCDGLRGEGTVAGRRVDCLTPDLQIRFHLGYPPDDNDRRDVRLLAERFDLPLPSEYQGTRL